MENFDATLRHPFHAFTEAIESCCRDYRHIIIQPMKPKRPVKIKTLEQAHDFVLQVKTCLIFGSAKSPLPALWDVVDLPGRQPGQKGWGQKVEAIWAWKNELPALFPDEIFYGKLPGGLAALMCLKHLREQHYPAHHRAVFECRPLARRAYEFIRREPHTTAELRRALSPAGAISKSKIDGALVELQVTLNIVRSNAPDVKTDTWLTFGEQYPQLVSTANRRSREAEPERRSREFRI